MFIENKEINTEIIDNIEKAQSEGYDNIVFLNAEEVNSPILTARESYKADSPFDVGWATYILVSDKYDFKNIVFLKQGDFIRELADGNIMLYNSYLYDDRDIVLEGSRTFFLGLADLEYNNRKNRIPQRAYYYGYEELYNSQFYRGVEVAVMTAEMDSPFYHIMQNEAWIQEEVCWINCGITNGNERYKSDRSYLENENQGIYGGYETEGIIGYTRMEETDNRYFSTYRYGTEFSYKFFNIEEDNKYILAFDVLEAYYTTERQRNFNI